MKFTIKRGVIVESEYGRFETREEAEKELAKRKKRNDARKARDDAYRSCGMVKVKGGLGGTYWE
jgi:hypothetical protein